MPSSVRSGRRPGWINIALVLAVVAAAGFLVTRPGLSRSLFASKNPIEGLPTWPVQRVDLTVSLTAGGTVESVEQTVIECQLERLEVSARGSGGSAGGSSTIISLIPEGSIVKKGDVLCRLDASEYEELARQQHISVEQSRSDYQQALLDRDIATMSVGEYRDGLMLQSLKELRGQIALSQSDWERARDRLAWSRKMFAKGYASKGQLTTEEFGLSRIALALGQDRTALNFFEKYTAPKYLRVLASNVLSAETVLSFQARRLQRTEDRLKSLQNQVERCVIKAPHDGYLIYANNARRSIRIEEGISVRQRQKLFYLPDLGNMQVSALIHESVVEEVGPGMLAKVKIEGFPDQRLEGHVTKVSQLPDRNDFNDVKYFLGTVQLHNVPKGLMPGMSAEVEVRTVQRPDVLAVPPDALTFENGHDFCYVAHTNSIERRSVALGQATRDLLEVKSGLQEGERVILDPTRLDLNVKNLVAPHS